MAPKHVKITETGFRAGIGFLLATAVTLAIARICIRAKLNRRVYVDDGLFFLAVATLIGGTIMTYLDIPYIYLQQNVQAGVEAPPADLIQQLVHSVKIQDSAVVLLSTTIFAVKLSFLAFFRSLIRRLRKLEIWWWVVLAIVVPSSLMLVLSNFISCSYFDERILVKCVSSGALKRQNDTLRAVTILDIISDIFIITIPVSLLWRVRISLPRKLALATTLCLSVFTIITAVVRVAGSNTVGRQVDSSWAIFWLQVEAAVAVMVVSVTAFRALFVAEQRSQQKRVVEEEESASRIGTWASGKLRRSRYRYASKGSEGGETTGERRCGASSKGAGEQGPMDRTGADDEERLTRNDGGGSGGGRHLGGSKSHSRDESQPSSYEMV